MLQAEQKMAPEITPNTFLTTTGCSSGQKTTIFFISGNPGLIGYYHPFLSLLSKYLEDPKEEHSLNPPSFQIYGCSLGGFEIDEHQPSPSPSPNDGIDLDLEDQICFVQGKLAALMGDETNGNSIVNSGSRQKVILIGHSVGAYIAMEILRRHREARPESAFDIVGGAMLFPTVKDIAASPSGQKLTVHTKFYPYLSLADAVICILC
jgi:pimeloyl-ACP methyl ester carboxylesterase